MAIDFHQSAEHMARCLMGYIKDDERIRREVYRSMGHWLARNTVADLRRAKALDEERLRRGSQWARAENFTDWKNEEHCHAMAVGSKRLAEAIAHARGM